MSDPECITIGGQSPPLQYLLVELLCSRPIQKPKLVLVDGVHPTMATKITYGWIKKGTDKPIATVASGTRMNLMGALNLDTMMVTYGSYETINSDAMDECFRALRMAYPTAAKIHLILDRGPYNTSLQTQ